MPAWPRARCRRWSWRRPASRWRLTPGCAACASRRRAAAALDEAWALLARLERAGDAELAALFGDLERIVANLEEALAARKRVGPAEDDE
ncbi:hypothetical protein [Massilia sp. Se16.2.3]|uniref:hypothetical protein n=1 Tax=Massilia sp. Se16.2.3 TaxID=2709303 RepID=UPI001E5B7996|nr:hypothetical protein [Massilia sp. Se16.2.3]